MNPVAIEAIGVVTPGAGDAGGSMGLIHTETRMLSELPRIGTNAPAFAGAKTPIADDIVGVDRLALLGAEALWQAVDKDLATRKIGLVVCAPTEADEPGLAGQANDFLGRLASGAEVALAPQWSRVFASGREAIFEALPFALAALAQPEVAAVCLLGVDSLVTKPRLRQFAERGGQAGAPPFGEAGAVLLLTQRPGPRALARLIGLGVADQPVEGPHAKALLAAIGQAVADAQLGQSAFAGLVHDMAGDVKESEELAWAKTANVFAGSPKIEIALPRIATGDAGAAMGVLALCAAAFFVDKQAWQGNGLCCFTSRTKRGAAILGPTGARR